MAAALAAAALLFQATPAMATHGQVELVSQGSADVNVRFRGASQQGGRALFLTAERLSPADTDSSNDLYRWSGGQPELISIGPAGGNGAFGAGRDAMSADGSHVFFDTDERLTAADTDDRLDVYERADGQTRLASLGSAGGNGNTLGEDDAHLLAASADGTRVYFRTDERLVSGDLGTYLDIYERRSDLGGQTSLVTGTSDARPDYFAFSDDGTRVPFISAGREIAADTDSYGDLYLFTDGALRLVSTGPASSGGQPISGLEYRGGTASLSHLFFYTNEQLTSDDTDTTRDLYQYETASDTTRLFSDGPSCPAPCPPFEWVAASRDGSATIISTAAGLDPADTDGHVDLYRRTSGGYEMVSRTEPGSNPCCGGGPFGYKASSYNGDRVVFSAEEYLTADDQDVGECQVEEDWYACEDLYQRYNGDTELLSGGAPATQGFLVTFAAASSDARRVFFYTEEPLVPQDTDTRSDLYARYSGVTSLVSVGGSGVFHVCQPFYCSPPEDALSDDGNRIFFETTERLVSTDTDNTTDTYVATVASGYPRPAGASPTYAYLVPAYQACTASDRTHGPPFAYASCSDPDQVSQHLTVGTPDANGKGAKSVGYARYGAASGNPAAPPDEANVNIYMRLSDVRVASDLSDYAGELELRTQIRITDRRSGPGTDEPATMEDLDFPVTVPCAATADTTIGARCEIATTAEAIFPGAVTEGARSIWQFGPPRVYDGGPDGLAATQDNTLFAVQGLFVP